MPTIDANGAQLHYVTQGSGQPLLLIHGTGGDADAFALVLGQLARSHTVIAYDRRGFSRSHATPHRPARYLFDHAADAAALLKALGGGPAKVVGWSAGGLIALALALEYPATVAGLVLYEPPYLAKKHASLGFSLAFLQIMTHRALGLKRSAARKFYRTVFVRRDGTNDFDSTPPEVREALLANAVPLLAELDSGTGEDFDRNKLKSLSLPITQLSGEQSAPMFAAADDRVASTVPIRRRVTAPNAGHMMQLTDPAAFVAQVTSLLQ